MLNYDFPPVKASRSVVDCGLLGVTMRLFMAYSFENAIYSITGFQARTGKGKCGNDCPQNAPRLMRHHRFCAIGECRIEPLAAEFCRMLGLVLALRNAGSF